MLPIDITGPKERLFQGRTGICSLGGEWIGRKTLVLDTFRSSKFLGLLDFMVA